MLYVSLQRSLSGTVLRLRDIADAIIRSSYRSTRDLLSCAAGGGQSSNTAGRLAVTNRQYDPLCLTVCLMMSGIMTRTCWCHARPPKLPPAADTPCVACRLCRCAAIWRLHLRRAGRLGQVRRRLHARRRLLRCDVWPLRQREPGSELSDRCITIADTEYADMPTMSLIEILTRHAATYGSLFDVAAPDSNINIARMHLRSVLIPTCDVANPVHQPCAGPSMPSILPTRSAMHVVRLTPLRAAGCIDVPPSEDYSCAQQAAWGKCGADFMVAGGFCAATCGRCSGGVRLRPVLQLECISETGFGLQRKPALIPTRPAVTPVHSCSTACTELHPMFPNHSGAACMQVGSTSPSATSPAASSSQSIPDYVTGLHNNYRAQHMNTPLLAWDGGIAATAQAWADNCVFQHSVRTA